MIEIIIKKNEKNKKIAFINLMILFINFLNNKIFIN